MATVDDISTLAVKHIMTAEVDSSALGVKHRMTDVDDIIAPWVETHNAYCRWYQYSRG